MLKIDKAHRISLKKLNEYINFILIYRNVFYKAIKIRAYLIK